MKTNWMIAAAALCVGAAGGYIAGNRGGDETVDGGVTMMDTKSGRAGVTGGPVAARPERARSAQEVYRLPGQMNRLQSLMDFYSGLEAGQFESEADRLELLPPQQRIMAAFLLFGRWAEVDPLAAMNYSNTMGFAGMFARPSILQGWASVDPENAARYFKENPREFAMMGGFGRGRGGPFGGGSASSVIAGEWARNDPDGALKWAMTLEGGDRSSAIGSVLREMAMSDPAAAAEKASTLAGEELGRAYRDIAQAWAVDDWQAAQAWVKGLPAEEQGAAMSAAIEGLASQDVQAAARELAALPADQLDGDAIEAVAENWAREDPAAAAAWLTGFEAEDKEGAMRDVMMSWTATDSAGARAFVEAQPAGELRDTAAATYVFSNRTADPAESIEVAETISDDGSRNRAIGMTVRRWMGEDEEAARAYVEGSTAISDEMKERIIEGGGRGRGGGGGRRGR